MYSVPHQMANLFIAEEKVVSVIQRAWERPYQSSVFPLVAQYMESWTSRHRELPMSPLRKESYYEDVLVKLVGNPVHAFNLMDRLVNLLPGIWRGMVDSDRQELSHVMRHLPVSPDSSDVEGTMQALIRVQFAYKCVAVREREKERE